MENSTKWIVGGAGIVGVVALLSASRLSRFSKEFILVVTPRVHDVDWTGMMVAIDITFKNPTDATLRLKHPTVILFDSKAAKAANTPILSSTVSDAQITIKPNSETRLNPVMLKLSLLDFSLIKAAITMVANYIARRPITLYTKTLSQVNGTIPVVQETESTLQRGQKDKTLQLPKPTGTVSGVSGLSGISMRSASTRSTSMRGLHAKRRLAHGRR